MPSPEIPPLTGVVESALDHGVTLESRVQWEHGGRSLYSRDPGGHSVELATPGIRERVA
jgi:hypothetical protein